MHLLQLGLQRNLRQISQWLHLLHQLLLRNNLNLELSILYYYGMQYQQCMIKAYQGQMFKLPLAGDIAEKQIGSNPQK